MDNSASTNSSPIRVIVFLNIAYCIISYFYTVCTGNYNGDFIDSETNLSISLLTLLLLFNIFPFVFIWKLYIYYCKKKNRSKSFIRLDESWLKVTALTILVLHLFVTIFWGVGKVGADAYQAPYFIKFLIQILLRFDPNIWGTFIILVVKRRNRSLILFVSLLLAIIGVFKGTFGFCYSIPLVLFVKYYDAIVAYVRRHLIQFLFFSFLFPFLVGFVYNLRDVIRGTGEGDTKYDTITLIGGKLIGRLSSYSNSTFLVDRAPYFYSAAQNLPNLFFQRQMLTAVTQSFATEDIPEKIIMGDSLKEGTTVMVGTVGILILSIYKSLNVLLLNIFTIVMLDLLIFRFCCLLRFNLAMEFAFLTIVGPTMSGVASEYFFTLLVLICLVFLVLLVNALKKIY